MTSLSSSLVKNSFRRTFYVLRDSRVANRVLGLPWLDDEQASSLFGTTSVFTLMDGTTMDTRIEELKLDCQPMSSCKVQELLSKTRRSRGRNADFYVIHASPTAEPHAKFRTREVLTA
jgi:hypothetical protein